MDDRLPTVAGSLLRDGLVDNTPDAYLAAIRILAAADRLAEDDRLADDDIVAAPAARRRHVA